MNNSFSCFGDHFNFFFSCKSTKENLIELCANSSARPSALKTYDGSRLADVHADPDETATSLSAIIKDSPSIYAKLMFVMLGILFLKLPFK